MANTKTMIDDLQEMLEVSEGYGISQSPDSNKILIEFPTAVQANQFADALYGLLLKHHNTREGSMRFSREHKTE